MAAFTCKNEIGLFYGTNGGDAVSRRDRLHERLQGLVQHDGVQWKPGKDKKLGRCTLAAWLVGDRRDRVERSRQLAFIASAATILLPEIERSEGMSARA